MWDFYGSVRWRMWKLGGIASVYIILGKFLIIMIMIIEIIFVYKYQYDCRYFYLCCKYLHNIYLSPEPFFLICSSTPTQQFLGRNGAKILLQIFRNQVLWRCDPHPVAAITWNGSLHDQSESDGWIKLCTHFLQATRLLSLRFWPNI